MNVCRKRETEELKLSDLRFIQSSFTGDGVFRDKKADFETAYILKKQMKSLYPGGGYSVVGQIGKGDEEIGVLVSNEQEEKVYKPSKPAFSQVKGYIEVGDGKYIAVVKSALLMWLLYLLIAAAVIVGLVFLIKNFVPSNNGEPETTKPIGVIDPNAVLGNGEISVPVKTNTKGVQIKVPGITEMKLKAGTKEQNFVFSNPEENPCYFVIEIELSDTGEIIYTSNLLPPGYSISAFTMNKALEAGTYNAIVHVKTFSFDSEQRKLNNMDIKTTIIAS